MDSLINGITTFMTQITDQRGNMV